MTNSQTKELLLNKAGSFLKENCPKQAIKELEKIDHGKLAKYDLCEYYIIFTEANFAFAIYDETYIDEAISLLAKTGNHEMFAMAKSLKARLIVAKGGRLIIAKGLLNESYVSFLRAGKLSLAATTLNKIANICLQTGEIESAINSMQRCLQLLKDDKNYSTLRRASSNLALIYSLSGKLNKAIEIYIDQYNTIPSRGEQSQYTYYLTYALTTAFKGDIKTAHDLISRTLQFSNDFRLEKADYYEYLGLIYNLEGKFKKAEKALRTGLKLSKEIGPESSLISQTKRLLADTYVGLGKYDLAQEMAEGALAVAEKISEKAEIAACYRIFAQVALHKGNKEEALEWFKKATDKFFVIKSRYELAVTNYLMGTSGLFDNGEHTYLLYKSKEYFESEDVKPYINKVNIAISHIDKPPIKISTNNKCVFIAEHPSTKKIVELAESIAQSNTTILLMGKTGTGKDQLAKYIHAHSGRNNKLVKVNTAAIPHNLIESELFGYEKGAFTGADKRKKGKFELAKDGTVYLNEIGDMPLTAQAKLLHVLEDKEIERLGSEEGILVNARVIAATNCDLRKMISKGKFREDLFYRLNQFTIELPSLSERPGDIPLLVKHFLKLRSFDFKNNGRHKDLDKLYELLSIHNWDGNVRELKTVIDRMYHFAGNDLNRMIEFALKNLSDSEVGQLQKLLKWTDGNQSKVGRLLNVSESAVRRRIKKYNLSKY